MKLEKYSEIEQIQYEEYIGNWHKANEKIIPSQCFRDKYTFEQMIEKWQSDETTNAYAVESVPTSLYFLISDDKIIGAATIKKYLNSEMEERDGNISFGIMPSERHKGFGSILVQMIISLAKERNYESILAMCDKENIFAQKAIEKNNGKYLGISIHNGRELKRYKIVIIEKPIKRRRTTAST